MIKTIKILLKRYTKTIYIINKKLDFKIKKILSNQICQLANTDQVNKDANRKRKMFIQHFFTNIVIFIKKKMGKNNNDPKMQNYNLNLFIFH